MKKIIFISALFILVTGLVQGQDMGAPKTMGSGIDQYYSFGWNFTFPLGGFHDWVDQAGVVGGVFGYRKVINNKLIVGMDLGWERVSAEYPNQMYQDPTTGVAITATNYRFTYMIPWQAVVGYQMNSDKMISPYVTLGIGTDYMEHHLVVQEYDIYKYRWDFSLTPEVGTVIKFGNYSNWAGLVAVNYKWTTNEIDNKFLNQTASNLSMVNIKVGLAYVIF
jgi:opacity protein-like surface antigen